jgi:two-component sensor histidine kinase
MTAPLPDPTRWTERYPLARLPLPAEIIAAAAATAVATGLRYLLHDSLPQGFPFLTYFPTVIIVAFLLGSRAGAVTAILSGLAAWYWFVPPIGSLNLSPMAQVAMVFYAFITMTEVALVHWMQHANQSLVVARETNARLAETRALLFRELQHRVSNNLQMIGALMTVQQRQITDPQARAALEEASRRLSVVGRISRQLYDPAGAGQQLKPFLDQLARDVIETSGRQEVRHSVDGDGDAKLSPEAAIPLALVVAEAVANAIEHGFEGRDDCEVQIRLARTADKQLCIEVEDNGHGLPEGFVLDGSDSLGLKISSMLVGQLGGRFTLTPSKGPSGTLARLELPLLA